MASEQPIKVSLVTHTLEVCSSQPVIEVVRVDIKFFGPAGNTVINDIAIVIYIS